jgi:hypothetical protein
MLVNTSCLSRPLVVSGGRGLYVTFALESAINLNNGKGIYFPLFLFTLRALLSVLQNPSTYQISSAGPVKSVNGHVSFVKAESVNLGINLGALA